MTKSAAFPNDKQEYRSHQDKLMTGPAARLLALKRQALGQLTAQLKQMQQCSEVLGSPAELARLQQLLPGARVIECAPHLVLQKPGGDTVLRLQPDGSRYLGQWKNGTCSGQGKAKFFNGMEYEGAWENNQPHGDGRMTLTDGRVIQGHWRRGSSCRFGSIRYPNGDVYTGCWSDGFLPQDLNGELLQRNGDSYRGGFREGKCSGQGTFTTAAGKSYTGHWEQGRLNGHAVIADPVSETRFEGSVLEREPHGKGELRSKTGRYDGAFVKGLRHGQGTLTFGNGDCYRGAFREGQICGQGEYIAANGTRRRGQWQQGRLHGHASIQFSNGDVYEGEFRQGLRHGKGTFTFASGYAYEALWEEGRCGPALLLLPDGTVCNPLADYSPEHLCRQNTEHFDAVGWPEGHPLDEAAQPDVKPPQRKPPPPRLRHIPEFCATTCPEVIFANGRQYTGQWKDGVFCGVGVMIYEDGGVYMGEWAYDRRQGRGRMIWPDGTVYEGDWVADLPARHWQDIIQKERRYM